MDSRLATSYYKYGQSHIFYHMSALTFLCNESHAHVSKPHNFRVAPLDHCKIVLSLYIGTINNIANLCELLSQAPIAISFGIP